MPRRDEESITIRELRLRVPGAEPAQARALGARIGELVAERLAATSQSSSLGRLDLRLAIASSEITPERVANAIVDAVEAQAS
jgi:hypothetical protein